eukprot:836211-Prorocentrum_minimum.AAC.2
MLRSMVRGQVTLVGQHFGMDMLDHNGSAEDPVDAEIKDAIVKQLPALRVAQLFAAPKSFGTLKREITGILK